jgi:hypothetical protein
MESTVVFITQEQNHIGMRPHPTRPVDRVAVPEGGSTTLFVLAAVAAIGWAILKRNWASRENAEPSLPFKS